MGEHFSVYSIMLRYISIKKWLTDFWWLTVVTISILKGLICEQKYLQQKDYYRYTSCKSFSIRFWKFAYSISLFKFIFKYTSCPLTKQHFIEMWNLHSDTYTGLTKPILGFGIGHVVTILALPHFFYLKVEELDMLHIANIFVVLQKSLCTHVKCILTGIGCKVANQLGLKHSLLHSIT